MKTCQQFYELLMREFLLPFGIMLGHSVYLQCLITNLAISSSGHLQGHNDQHRGNSVNTYLQAFTQVDLRSQSFSSSQPLTAYAQRYTNMKHTFFHYTTKENKQANSVDGTWNGTLYSNFQQTKQHVHCLLLHSMYFLKQIFGVVLIKILQVIIWWIFNSNWQQMLSSDYIQTLRKILKPPIDP